MKWLALIVITSLIIYCAPKKSKEQIAHQNVVQQLKETMHDFSSYQSVKWDSLDSSYSNYLDLPLHKAAMAELTKSNEDAKESLDYANIYSGGYTSTKFNYYMDKAKDAAGRSKKALAIIDSIESSFVRKFDGWTINHSYRGKNANGK